MNILIMDMYNIPFKPNSIHHRKLRIRKTMKLVNGDTTICVTGCVYAVKNNFTNSLHWCNDFYNLKKNRQEVKCLLMIELEQTTSPIN